MKKLVFALLFIFSLQLSQAQNNDKFVTAMKSTIAAIDTSFANPANLLSVANRFERIALAEKNQWLPFYYAAYCQINYGFVSNNPSGLDAVADRAEALVNKADSLSPNNSELSTLRAMIATERMIVNPMQRYMQYGPLIDQQLEKAKAQDPTNPRPFWFKGENLKNTPEQYGGGCAVAKPQLTLAIEKFEKFTPATELHPNWGKQRTEMLLKECQ